MPGLVAGGVVRYSIIGSYSGREVANILDVHIDITGSITDRQEAVEDQAAIIVSAWADEVCDVVCDDYVASEVRWVDLNSLTGSVGVTSTGTGTNFPKAGVVTASPMPGNVAFRLNKQITAARGQRKGRMYLVGVPEDNTATGAPNDVIPANITIVNTKMAAFKSAVEQSAGTTPPNYDSKIVVVHTHVDNTDPLNPVVVYDGKSNVQSFQCDATLGSMRRRLRG